MSERSEAIVDIIDECDKQGLTLDTQKAYVLATVEHETGNTFKPVKEGFFLKNPLQYLKRLRYYPYYGRGYVQLTWKENYRKYSDLLGVDLVGNPDLACHPNIARYVLVHGFRTGAFTGKEITDYVTVGKTDFINARRCINGTDKAAHIAQMAAKWLRVLRAAA